MSIAKLLTLLASSILLISCANMEYQVKDPSRKTMAMDEGNTDKGIRYLLGRGVPKSDSKAFHYFNQAAKHGDPFAANELGYMYSVGKGVKKNYPNARKSYEYAAEYGLASAQYNLALMYINGLGGPVDKQGGYYWIKKSAEQGFKPAQQTLG